MGVLGRSRDGKIKLVLFFFLSCVILFIKKLFHFHIYRGILRDTTYNLNDPQAGHKNLSQRTHATLNPIICQTTPPRLSHFCILSRLLLFLFVCLSLTHVYLASRRSKDDEDGLLNWLDVLPLPFFPSSFLSTLSSSCSLTHPLISWIFYLNLAFLPLFSSLFFLSSQPSSSSFTLPLT